MTRLTVPAGVTHIQAFAGIRYDNNDTDGTRAAIITKNGDSAFIIGGTQATASSVVRTTANAASQIHPVVEGDYFEVRAFQDSGSVIPTIVEDDCFFSIIAIR